MNIKNMEELTNAVLDIFPEALIEEEDDGNIVIITNMQEDSKGNIVEFEDKD